MPGRPVVGLRRRYVSLYLKRNKAEIVIATRKRQALAVSLPINKADLLQGGNRTMEDNYIRQYHSQIVNGEVVVGRWIKLIYDYIVNKLDDGTFSFNQSKVDGAIDWMEHHCFHTEGPLAPQPIKFELWQKAFIACMFGICDPKTGKRQFTEVVLVIARKNGKTLFAASLAKYVWYNEGYGARIFCTAPTLNQADLVYNSVWNMTQLDPEWQALKKQIQDTKNTHNEKTMDDGELAKHTMTCLRIPAKNAEIKKIAAKENQSNGFNPNLAICDEIASWEGDKGLKMYEVMKSGMGARDMGENPGMLLSCSTSGYINDGIYDELVKRSTRFLLGESKETKLLPFLYMIDDVEKWNDIEELKKSNPNLNVSTSAPFLMEEAAAAEGSLSKKAEFICKYCNIKQNSSQAWLEATVVENSFGDALNLEDFKGCYCVGGIDLSRTTDLTSCCVVIEKDGILNVFSKFYLPADKIEEATARDGIPYSAYIQQGFLEPSGDNFVDYHDCLNWFISLIRDYKVYPLQVGYDRYSAQYLVQELESAGFHMDDVFQGFNLTPVINEMEGSIKDGRFNFGNNSLLKIHLLNSALKKDTELNKVRLVKLNANDHIDGTAALLDALCVRQKWHGDIGEQLKNKGK